MWIVDKSYSKYIDNWNKNIWFHNLDIISLNYAKTGQTILKNKAEIHEQNNY